MLKVSLLWLNFLKVFILSLNLNLSKEAWYIKTDSLIIFTASKTQIWKTFDKKSSLQLNVIYLISITLQFRFKSERSDRTIPISFQISKEKDQKTLSKCYQIALKLIQCGKNSVKSSVFSNPIFRQLHMGQLWLWFISRY